MAGLPPGSARQGARAVLEMARLMSLSALGGKDLVRWEAAAAQVCGGSSGDHGSGGACRTERLLAREHVPGRAGELAGELDP